MTEAPPPTDPDDAVFARLAELDLMAAEKVHARLMSAEEPREIVEFARAYHRTARSVRQTLALKARLRREREQDCAAAPRPVAPDLDLEGFRIDRRMDDLQDAVGRVIAVAHEGDPERQVAASERFYREMDDWVIDELFGLEELDDHVAEVCRDLGLPEDLAARWRSLPAPPRTPDPAASGDDPPAEPPAHDSG